MKKMNWFLALLAFAPTMGLGADGYRELHGRFAEDVTTYPGGWGSGYRGSGAGLLSNGRPVEERFNLPDCKTHRAGVPAAYAAISDLVHIEIKTICNRVVTAHGTDNRFLFDLTLAPPGKYIRKYRAAPILRTMSFRVGANEPQKSWEEAESAALAAIRTVSSDIYVSDSRDDVARALSGDQTASRYLFVAYGPTGPAEHPWSRPYIEWSAKVSDVSISRVRLKNYDWKIEPYNYDHAIETFEFEYIPDTYTVEIL